MLGPGEVPVSLRRGPVTPGTVESSTALGPAGLVEGWTRANETRPQEFSRGVPLAPHAAAPSPRTPDPDAPARPNRHRRDVHLSGSRQERLLSDNLLQPWVVVSEAVLLQLVGGPHVLKAQLKHLLASSEHPRATIQVLPFSRGAYARTFSPYVVLGFPEEGGQPVRFHVAGAGNGRVPLPRPLQRRAHVSALADRVPRCPIAGPRSIKHEQRLPQHASPAITSDHGAWHAFVSELIQPRAVTPGGPGRLRDHS
ncbi:Scr1 family TA system antitoxin-like transcriptional regulator [Streptomyces pulveraceus]|uniref:Scr1 family TA system antitoxin-like transcriptional regulator n=2 Tax=Streptomyces pulveraceus TaxID=68258 RepID=A0ABW1GGQ8_9ACTN